MQSEMENILRGRVDVTADYESSKKIIGINETTVKGVDGVDAPLSKQNAFSMPEITPEPAVAAATPELEPAMGPTIEPATAPVIEPAMAPVIEPTIAPTIEPVMAPTITPTVAPEITPVTAPVIESNPIPEIVSEPVVAEEKVLPPFIAASETPSMGEPVLDSPILESPVIDSPVSLDTKPLEAEPSLSTFDAPENSLPSLDVPLITPQEEMPVSINNPESLTSLIGDDFNKNDELESDLNTVDPSKLAEANESNLIDLPKFENPVIATEPEKVDDQLFETPSSFATPNEKEEKLDDSYRILNTLEKNKDAIAEKISNYMTAASKMLVDEILELLKKEMSQTQTPVVSMPEEENQMVPRL